MVLISLWPSILLTMAISAPAARVFVAHEWAQVACGHMRQIMPLAPARVAACGLRWGEGADESASLAWLDFAQSFDGEAWQRECAAGQFGFRRHDGLMPAHPLQATLHVQDT